MHDAYSGVDCRSAGERPWWSGSSGGMDLAKTILMGDLPWRQSLELADGVDPPLLPRQERHRVDSIMGGDGDLSPAQAL